MKNRFALFCGVWLFVLPLVGQVRSQEWSRFRGPNGSGVVEAPNLPVEFGTEQNVVWAAEVPFARSSPILTEGRVFLTGSDDKNLIVMCLDRRTGSRLWERRLERARQDERYKGNDSGSSSPVSDGENVYAFFPEFGLVSFDGDGKRRWVYELGPFQSFYGMSSSPIVAGDSIVLQCDQKSGSYLIALDKDNGMLRWKTERPGMVESFTTPVLYPSAEKPLQLITNGNLRATGYSLTTGEELWKEDGLGAGPVCSPVLESQRLIVCAPDHAEQPMPAFSVFASSFDKNEDKKLSQAELQQSPFADHFGWVDRDDDGFIEAAEWGEVMATMSVKDFGLVAMDLGSIMRGGDNDTKLWRFKKSLASIATPLVYRNVLYMVKDGGILTSLDPATGKEHKRGRIPKSGGEYFPSPVAGDGKIYIANNSGKVVVLRAGPDWEVLSVNDLQEDINATPAIGEDGMLFVRTKSKLYCFGVSK